jgi:hypothetical protein
MAPEQPFGMVTANLFRQRFPLFVSPDERRGNGEGGTGNPSADRAGSGFVREFRLRRRNRPRKGAHPNFPEVCSRGGNIEEAAAHEPGIYALESSALRPEERRFIRRVGQDGWCVSAPALQPDPSSAA